MCILSVNKTGDVGPVYLLCQSKAHTARSCDLTKEPRSAPPSSGALCTQTLTCNKDGSPQRGSEIYLSHLLFQQTVAAEWGPRESDVHKSSRVLESIMGTVHSGSWKWNSQDHQSASNRSRWNDEAECEFWKQQTTLNSELFSFVVLWSPKSPVFQLEPLCSDSARDASVVSSICVESGSY